MGWIEDKLENNEVITAKMLYDHFGFQHVIGIYLYGRKAIAGPICVVALILRPNHKFDLKPADKLSKAECHKLNDAIRSKATLLNIGWVAVDAIDVMGLHSAIMMAINTSLAGVSGFNPPSLVFIDNFTMDPIPNGLRDSKTPIYVVKKGKKKIETIMAASIIARVAHDSILPFFHEKYPEYDWINNGGFATPQHINLIKQHGISPFHRNLSQVKALQGFKAFPNERWRKEYENSYFSA